MSIAPTEHENEEDKKTKNPNNIQERAVGILDTIDALIGVANGSENGEIPQAEKQAGQIEAEPESVKLNLFLSTNWVTFSIIELIRYASIIWRMAM